MKNIHVLPTEKPSRLYQLKDDILRLDYKIDKGTTNQNIYITDDSKIQEGDWVCNVVNNNIYNADKAKLIMVKENLRKIILTTDPDLIKDGVQAIDDDFLEWFVKNPSCEYIQTTELSLFNGDTGKSGHYKYEIIIPKEELKQDTVGKEFYESADKTITVYRQETLEEAAEKYAKKWYKSSDELSEFLIGVNANSFKHGAKWQQEQDKNKYSEEDMIEFAVWMYLEVGQNSGKERTNKELFKEWFEQFKKK